MIEPLIRKPFSMLLFNDRITLELVSLDKTNQLWDIINEDRKKRSSIWPGLNTVDDLSEYIKDVIKANPAQEVVYCISTEKNKCIGTIHLHTLNYADHKLEIGYWIAQKHEGFGFVHDSIKLVENEVKDLGFHRIEIKCLDQNRRSIHVAERAGYVLEGIGADDCVRDGIFQSTYHFAKILDKNKTQNQLLNL